MTIELTKDQIVAGKLHKAGVVLGVIEELGIELVVAGKARCIDGSFDPVVVPLPTRVPQAKQKVSTTKK